MLASRVRVGPTSNAGSNSLVGASESRVSITFFAPNGGLATLTHESGVTQGQGILLTNGSNPVHLNIHDHGDCVQMEWYVNYSTSGFPISVIETLALCEPDQKRHFGQTIKQRNRMWSDLVEGVA